MKDKKDKNKQKKYAGAKEIVLVNSVTALRFLGSFLIIPIFKTLGGIGAAIFSAIFMMTDCIDGFLARKMKASTFFGSIFDGLTDKTFALLTLGLLFCIEPSVYIIPILFELYIMYIQKKKMDAGLNVQSNNIGKFKTWVISASMIASLGLVEKYNLSFIFENNNVENEKGIISLLVAVLPTIIFQSLTAQAYAKECDNNAGVKESDIEYIEGEEKEEETLNWINTHLNYIEKELKVIELEKEKLKEQYTMLEKAKILKDALFDPEYYAKNKDKQIRVLTKDLFTKNVDN